MKIKTSVSIFCLAFISSAHSMDEKIKLESPKDMLFHGARDNNINLINNALYRGVNVNAELHGGYTALWVAIWPEQENIVKLLLQANADPNLQTQTRELV